jgi:predicted dehydrogenase
MSRIRLGVIGTGMAWERLHRPTLEAAKELIRSIPQSIK